MKGRRVGVIGNGASAIQFVPEIAKQIGGDGSIHIFQRSASWVVPRPQRAFMGLGKTPLSPRALDDELSALENLLAGRTHMGRLPQKGEDLKKMANEEMEMYVKDSEKQKTLTPDYEPGCKRILFANDWWPTVGQDNVEVITAPIAQISEKGVRTQDGSEVELDTLIYSTGFDTTHFLGPLKMTGLANRELKDVWKDGAFAHHGITVSGFPTSSCSTDPTPISDIIRLSL